MSKAKQHPEMTAVESEAITHIGYDEAGRTLYVHFAPKKEGEAGRKYKFSGVSPEKHAALMAAESKGRHFMTEIRLHHDFERY